MEELKSLLEKYLNENLELITLSAVSYTHRDVYKRQGRVFVYMGMTR